MQKKIEIDSVVERTGKIEWINPLYQSFIAELEFPQDTPKQHIKKGIIRNLAREELPVYVKFYGTETNYLNDSRENEIDGYKIAQKSGVKTPNIIAYGIDPRGLKYIVIEDLFNSTHFHEEIYYQNSDTRNIIKNLAKNLYYLYLNGLIHNDTDSVNILVSNQDIYLIDFAQSKSIDPETTPFPLKEIFWAIASCQMYYLTTQEHLDWAKQIAIEELKNLGATFK